MIKTLKSPLNKVKKNESGQILRHDNGIAIIEHTFPAGTQATVEFNNGKMIVIQDGISCKCRAANYVKYFGGKVPSETTLWKWQDEGYCKTVTGHKTEPDGYGPDESPSWMLALGLI